MARINNTPVDFWLSCSFRDLQSWITANNEIEAESQKK
jgi:hypothetical protein